MSPRLLAMSQSPVEAERLMRENKDTRQEEIKRSHIRVVAGSWTGEHTGRIHPRPAPRAFQI